MRTNSRLSMFLVGSLLLGASVVGSSAPAWAKGKKPTVSAKTKAKAKVKAPPVKKIPPVSADAKKKMATLFAGFKFGMSKDEVTSVFSKQIDAKYEDQIKATSDISAQDRLRANKKKELALITKTYIAFDAKPSPWDVSIIEDEFAHNTGEAMLEQWENTDGKNQRRFFFFHDGKLYKMFVALDLSMLPADQQNSETFQRMMFGQYGVGEIQGANIIWRAGEFDVRAVDKIKMISSIGIAVEDPAETKTLVAIRETNAPKKVETNSIIKSVIDTDGSQAPDVKQNANAVDAVIKAQGTSGVGGKTR